MKQLFTWVFSALLFAAIGGFCVWTFMHGGHGDQAEHEGDAEATATSTAPAELPVLSRDKSGAVVVRLEGEVQQRVGLQTQALVAATDQPEVIAYGTLQEDPAQVFALRAPFAGTVVADKTGRWVGLGDAVVANAAVGSIAPRIGPVEQADMASKLAGAHAEVQSARASLDALRVSLDSKRKLNVGQKIVSDQTLQEAEAKVKGEEARLQAATEIVRVLMASVSAASRPADAMPLITGRAGRVVEVLAQPGEAVEAGQALVKLASYDRLYARVSLPAGESVANVGSTRIVIASDENHPLPSEGVVTAASADALTGGQTFVFAFRPQRMPVQPGMPVAAHIKIPGEPAKGVIVPSEAVVRYAGAGWVYVKNGEETFVRRQVPLNRRVDRGWFVSTGTLSVGDNVVIVSAQNLLSHELQHQTGGGGEEEE